MRFLAFAVLASVALAGARATQNNSDQPKFSLTIRAFRPEVALGSKVGIGITITNTSEESLNFAFGHHGGLPDGYEYDVRDEQGAPVSKYGKRYVQLPSGDTMQLPTRRAGSVMRGGIQPGKSVEQGAIVSELYQFDHPGKYTIQVSRKEPWSATVYSNTITITVVEPPPPATAPQ